MSEYKYYDKMTTKMSDGKEWITNKLEYDKEVV